MKIKTSVILALIAAFAMTTMGRQGMPFDFNAFGFNTAVALVLILAFSKGLSYLWKNFRL